MEYYYYRLQNYSTRIITTTSLLQITELQYSQYYYYIFDQDHRVPSKRRGHRIFCYFYFYHYYQYYIVVHNIAKRARGVVKDMTLSMVV